MPVIVVPIDNEPSTLDKIVTQCRLKNKAGIAMTEQDSAYCKAAEDMSTHQSIVLLIVIAVVLAIFGLIVWRLER